MLATAEGGPLTKKQSKAKMEALERLERDYSIVRYLEPYDLAIVLKDDLHGVVALDGRVVLPLEYYYLEYQSSAGLFVLSKESEEGVGFADRQRKQVLPYGFSGELLGLGVDFFHDGMTCLPRDGKYGIMDTAGRVVVPYVYDTPLSVCPAGKGLMLAHDYDRSTTCLLRFDGDTVIGPVYDIQTVYADDNLRQGKAMLQVSRIGGDGRDTLLGLYDTEGREVVPCRYRSISQFIGGKAVVERKGAGCGLLDFGGRETVPCSPDRYPGEPSFLLESGLIVTYRDNQCGVVDPQGRQVIPFHDGYYYADTRERIALLDNDYRLSVYDVGGRLLERYDAISDIEESVTGFPVHKEGGKWGFLDERLHLLLPTRYNQIRQMDRSHYLVELDDGQNAVVDPTGRVLLQGPYETVYHICDGIFEVYSCYNTDGDREALPYLKGLVDVHGNTTFSAEEMKRMEEWYRKNNNIK